MVTVHRAYGFRFAMFVNDHDPPHVRVFGHGGEARIILEGPHGLAVDWFAGINRGDMRRLIREARQQQERLIAMWRTIHEQ